MNALPADLPLCMDGRMLVPEATGVGRYAEMLAQALPMVGGKAMILVDRGGSRLGRGFVAASGAPRSAQPDGTWSGPLEVVATRHLFRAAQAYFTCHGRMLRVRIAGRPGIMHWTYPVPIHVEGWHNLYTVHDIIPIEHPGLSPVNPRRLTRMLAKIAEVAAGVITVSNDSRSRILTQMAVPADKVVNCGQSVPLDQRSSGGALPRGLQPGQYLLFCGSIEPRKNIQRLAAAHAVSGVSLPLVLAGPEGWKAEAETLLSFPGIIRIPFLPRSELECLIAGARAMLFPSLAEGFGIPVIEAMGGGIPVLTSDRGATAEIAGNAALLVDPEDLSALAAGIRCIASDGVLRDELVRAGRVRASDFTPDRFIARIRNAYARIIVGAPLNG